MSTPTLDALARLVAERGRALDNLNAELAAFETALVRAGRIFENELFAPERDEALAMTRGASR
jgi:hypothetical protein